MVIMHGPDRNMLRTQQAHLGKAALIVTVDFLVAGVDVLTRKYTLFSVFELRSGNYNVSSKQPAH